MQKELRLRILSGIVMATVVLFATWAGGFIFSVLAVAIALLVYYEWSTMTRLAERDFQANAFGWLSQVAVGGLVLFGDEGVTLPVLGGFALISLVWTYLRKGSFWQPAGIVYAGLTGVSMASIRADDSVGLIAMLFVFAIVWATDILAYFVGRKLGGPKLAPRISPGKTWSGAIGGAISGVIAGTVLVYSQLVPVDIHIPLVALLLSIASQFGDLFESFIKRRFGAKDSSRLIPGHGGVMDRVDGLVFACFAALLLALLQIILFDAQTASTGAVLLGL